MAHKIKSFTYTEMLIILRQKTLHQYPNYNLTGPETIHQNAENKKQHKTGFTKFQPIEIE